MVARGPLAVPLLGLAGFAGLLGLVAGHWPPLDRFDLVVSEHFRVYGNLHPTAIAVLRIATDVAATIPYLLAGLVTSLLLVARREIRPAAFCAAVTVLVPSLWGLMHWLLRAPRPSDGFVVVDSNGFPSGHTANATAAGLAAVLLLWPRLRPAGRVIVGVLAAALAAFVGATRVALLAHWPADVVGGWLLALAVVPLVARVGVRRVADPETAARSGSGQGL